MLPDISGQRFHIVMTERILQTFRFTIYDHVLVHFHIAHRGILVLESTLEVSSAPTKKRQLAKIRARVTKTAPEKVHLQVKVISVNAGFMDHLADFRSQ